MTNAAWRRVVGRAGAVAVACLVAGSVETASVSATALARTERRVAIPSASVGSVDVVAPRAGVRVLGVPITLSVAATSVVRLRYTVVGDTAVAGRDVVASTGVATIPVGRIETIVDVEVLADRTAPTSPCWYQTALACATFSVKVSPVDGDATIAPSQSDDTILWMGTGERGVAVGDALLVDPRTGPVSVMELPVTLSRPYDVPVTVGYELVGGSARVGLDVNGTRGELRFRPGVVTDEVPVAVGAQPGQQPDEVFYLKLTSSLNAGVERSTGIGIIATSARGVPDHLAHKYAGATLTQVVDAASGVGDTYDVSSTKDGTVMSAYGPIAGANDRMVFWPRNETPESDQESCATWSSQDPEQGDGVITQEGLALRVATADGVTRAITLTKNVFGQPDNPMRNDVLDVLLWNTSHVADWHKIGDVEIESYLAANRHAQLPWDVCARVVGSLFQVELWLPGQQPPAWGDTAQGGSFQLPAGWDYPGVAGWYVGHLATGAKATYADEFEGAPQSTPSVPAARAASRNARPLPASAGSPTIR